MKTTVDGVEIKALVYALDKHDGEFRLAWVYIHAKIFFDSSYVLII